MTTEKLVRLIDEVRTQRDDLLAARELFLPQDQGASMTTTDRDTRQDPAAALAAIIHAGFDTDATPNECESCTEQAGYDAYHDGFLVSDALHLENNHARAFTPDGQHLAAWMRGFWQAVHDATPDFETL